MTQVTRFNILKDQSIDLLCKNSIIYDAGNPLQCPEKGIFPETPKDFGIVLRYLHVTFSGHQTLKG